jgi:hypothetical protein
LAEALRATFTHRKTTMPAHKPIFAEQIYDNNSDRQILWETFIYKSGIKHVPEKLSAIAKEIEDFLIQPLDAINKGQEFDKSWKAPGPWHK